MPTIAPTQISVPRHAPRGAMSGSWAVRFCGGANNNHASMLARYTSCLEMEPADIACN